MVALGYGKFVRAQDIIALLPIEDTQRGDGRRRYVHVAGIAGPIVASRSERAILATWNSPPARAASCLPRVRMTRTHTRRERTTTRAGSPVPAAGAVRASAGRRQLAAKAKLPDSMLDSLSVVRVGLGEHIPPGSTPSSRAGRAPRRSP